MEDLLFIFILFEIDLIIISETEGTAHCFTILNFAESDVLGVSGFLPEWIFQMKKTFVCFEEVIQKHQLGYLLRRNDSKQKLETSRRAQEKLREILMDGVRNGGKQKRKEKKEQVVSPR